MKKRILAIATALVLCLTLLPATVLAEEPSQDPARPVVTGAPLADTNQASLSYNESGATTTTTRDYTTLTDALEAISSLPPGATNVVITLLSTDSAYNVATTGNDTTYTLPTGIYTITSKEKGQKSLYFKKGSNSSNDFCQLQVPAGADVTIDGKSVISIMSNAITVSGSLTLGNAYIFSAQGGSESEEYTPVTIKSGGTLTLSKLNSAILGDVTVEVGGNMTLANGGYKATGYTPKATISGGTVTMKNGTLYNIVEITNNGELNLQGGAVESPITCTNGQLTVSGGTVNEAVTLAGGTATISGGTFKSTFSKTGGTATISGGTFEKGVKTTVSNETVGAMLADGYGFLRNYLWYDKDSTKTDLSYIETNPGNILKTLTLKVVKTPIQGNVTIDYDPIDLGVGGTVALTANYTTDGGNYESGPTFAWKKAGEDTSIGNGQTLTITPESAGSVTYTCTVTLFNYQKTGSVTLNVPDPVPADKITQPTAKRNLTYTGNAQSLIEAGSIDQTITGYHMEYRLGTDGNWETDVSRITATNASTYQVYYRVVRNTDNTTGIYGKYESSIPVIIAPLMLSANNCSTDGTKAIFIELNNPTFNGDNLNPHIVALKLRKQSGSSWVDVETLKMNNSNRDYEISSASEIDAGEYTGTIIGQENYGGSVNFKWYIKKAPVTTTTPLTHEVRQEFTVKTVQTLNLDPVITSLISGRAYPDNAGTRSYTLGTLSADAGVTASVSDTTLTYTVTDPAAATGQTYVIPVTVSSKNYQDVTLNVTVALLDQTVPTGNTTIYPHSADSRTFYSVSVSQMKNGGLTLSHSNAREGGTVTITVLPDRGYTLETLTVLCRDGKEIELTDQGDGKYTFIMPAGNVDITASFMEDNAMMNFFTDVPTDAYCYEAVLWAVQNGITTGSTETSFDPGGSCTRAQVVTFLWRAAGCPVVHDAMTLADVDESTYYAEAIRWAASLGIVDGYGNGLFGVYDAVTRAQVVTILYRWTLTQGLDVNTGEDTNILSYNDVLDIPEYAIEAFQWACGVGIVQGNNVDLFPGQACNRGQIVTMLHRMLVE